MWYVVNQRNGVSALGLQRVLGFGSYQTAWAWLHKLRRAMVLPGRELLSGAVEVDETLVGGVKPGGGRRSLDGKTLVVIAVECYATRPRPGADVQDPERVRRRAHGLRARERRPRSRPPLPLRGKRRRPGDACLDRQSGHNRPSTPSLLLATCGSRRPACGPED